MNRLLAVGLLTFVIGFVGGRLALPDEVGVESSDDPCAPDQGRSEVRSAARVQDSFDAPGPSKPQEQQRQLRPLVASPAASILPRADRPTWSPEDVRKLSEVLAKSPQPFPSDLEDQFRPSSLAERLQRSIDSCNLRLNVLELECEEFPCIAWVDSRELRLDMGSCPKWSEAFDEDTLARLEVLPMSDGGQLVLAALMPVPRHPVQRKVAVARLEDRCRVTAARLATALAHPR